MAAEVSTVPGVNGNYAPLQGYGGVEQQASGAYNSNVPTSQTPYSQALPSTSSAPATAEQVDIPKDEVGWFFVEQYYTTLSRSPEKLYLLYNKRSQFVSGQETDKVAVCVGQRAINERIKELDFQDCKVRVTNVDSQASDSNIVIQVIGEISNKSQPHKKFTQTFVLAAQPNGYFVLNDIFRYLIDEEDEPENDVAPVMEEMQQAPAADSGYQEPAPTVDEVEPKTLTSSEDPVAVENDAKAVDRELEEKVLKEQPKSSEAPAPAVNGVLAGAEADQAENTTAAAVDQSEQFTTEQSPDPTSAEADLKLEKPKDPEPTPSASPSKQAPPQPSSAPKPAVPNTWAKLAAAANKTTPTPQPAPNNTVQTRPAQPAAAKPSTPASAAALVPTVPPVPAAQRNESPTTDSQDEWTAVGGGHNRQQSRQTNTQQQDGPQNRGYIKNVHEGVDGGALRSQLEQYGEITYFDIARQKNCAFVDFKTADGYNAAVAANPHTIGSDKIYVEERRVRPGSTPYVPRGQYQGNRGRGNMNQNQPRGGFQNRGAFTPRGSRGGTPAPRGRGGTQAA